MSWITERLGRLRFIVAECIRKDLTPEKNGFADHIHNITSCYGLRPQTCQEYVKTLLRAWNFDKWKSYVRYNDNLTQEEIKVWIEKHSKK